ncbi:Adenylate kinase-related kinase [Devosia sp. LC5]|uniref:ATPase AAA n=1 Tax=Devosia sp. LC5 TaxID=1502724 RepID=UPI0004E46FB6|nr:ATPase AAA [Devosia sp. LC5]KFC62861.1 Adenylate kinase-related kinase [Devosia sp. LC5]
MQTFQPLDALGRRIVIMGPTNAGKSTLAIAIGKKLDIPAIHLDQLRHLPNTDWQVRPDAEFHALHDAAILEPGWVMEGNYSVLMPQRFARATGVVVVDDHYLRRFSRYFRRTLLEKERAGNLPGNRDSIKWQMVSWIWKTRNNADRSRRVAKATGLPMVFCASLREVKALARAWNL